MSRQFTRRDFLRTTLAAGTLSVMDFRVAFAQDATGTQTAVEPPKPRPSGDSFWYRCNFHNHSQWSDGKDLIDCTCRAYKQKGYHFFCPSDHNIFQADKLRFDGFCFNHTPAPEFLPEFQGETSLWKRVSPNNGWPLLTEEHLAFAEQQYGVKVRSKVVNGVKYVRMTPFAEVQQQVSEPGQFLMVPGFEQTGRDSTGCEIHMNFVNVESTFDYIVTDSGEETIRQTLKKGRELYDGTGKPYIFTTNHPLWRYYDWGPSALMNNPEVRYLELNNNEISGPPALPGAWTPESFVDIINAYRITHDQQLVYVTGTDDSHGIRSNAAFAHWQVVRAPELTVEAIFAAMERGDYYTSSGADFEDIQFDGKTLTVKAVAEPGARYQIEFFGTKKGYDDSVRYAEVQEPPRKVELYSDQIGQKLLSVDGTKASYTLQSDDLYVRARLMRIDPPAKVRFGWEPTPAAWTQVYR